MRKVAILSLMLLLSGCVASNYGSRSSRFCQENSGAYGANEEAAGYAPVQTVSLDSLEEGTSGEHSSADQHKANSLQKSVYFPFDSFEILPQYQGVILSNVNYLRANHLESIRIVGNTDERGSREYNLALGQKRAGIVRQAFVSMGISPSRVEAVSFGKEKPRAKGHDEKAWSENRRSDLLYKSLGEF
ncbi:MULTISPECIES: OmpA family protein [Candidatus Ichthyocystis]|uniref:Peptidoglycan-associated lipoprotein n=1 Tax=Candidatus Ichthyocystis hellenicum TaxID=1561003 RepID=A0A0S4M2R9_9BURK|nr:MULTISPECIES: OmpA family protein [Ichthyocystis]CUT17311.1 putative peptidoglycan-associated lipoprotein, OmpA family [Candidatus Ichthyocystis hellenicum]